ncbi:MAG: twin-arginine translocase subunit TatC [Coriobacteriia bacterium]|nr:twin-arginine translocase subunit TatC [Coriobacteriia bacterium]
MPVNPRVMPFTKHFIELRKRFIYILIVFFLFLILFYQEYFYVRIMDLLLYPLGDILPESGLVALGPFELLTFRFKVAIYSALVASSPVIFYNIFAFFMPAFKKQERKWLFPTVAAAVLLFLVGVAFAYFIILGSTFEWLFAQGAGAVHALPSANLYLSGIALLLVGFGLAFELPLVVFYLIGWGVIPFDTLVKGWRFAVVGIMVVAAIATPDWSPITMGGLSLAMLALYFAAVGLARVVFAEKIKQQRIEQAEYEAMYADTDLTEEQDLDLPKNFDTLSRTEQMIARGQAQHKAHTTK